MLVLTLCSMAVSDPNGITAGLYLFPCSLDRRHGMCNFP